MKEAALTLLKIAASLFPPLATLLTRALDAYEAASDEEFELSESLQEILPPSTTIHAVVANLEQKRGLAPPETP